MIPDLTVKNLQTVVAFDPCEDVEHCWSEKGGEAIWIISLPAGLPGQNIILDDLEFHIEEAVTPDAIAQKLFVLAGGPLDQTGSCGTIENLNVYYDLQ